MIIFGSIILLALVITIIAVVRHNKYNVPHSYNNVISTKNISYVEFKKYNPDSSGNNPDDYITLTDEEKATFIKSISDDNLKYKYWGEPRHFKGVYYKTFKIHYEDGRETWLDRNHVWKFNKDGKEIYHKILLAYECEIGENLFKTN